jgi:hypothetical protein
MLEHFVHLPLNGLDPESQAVTQISSLSAEIHSPIGQVLGAIIPFRTINPDTA